MTIEQTKIGRAIAIFFVVFGHLGFIQNGGALGVAMFLTISGYGIAKSNDSNLLGERSFWRKRFKKVYCPYLVWSVCLVIFLRIIGSSLLYDRKEIGKLLMAIFGSPYNMYDPTMWYISYIFIMYMIYWISFEMIGEKKYSDVIFLVLSVFLGGICSLIYPTSVGIYLYIFSFPIGVFIAKKEKITNKKEKSHNIIDLIILGIVLTVMVQLSKTNVLFYELLTIVVSLNTVWAIGKIKVFSRCFLYKIGEASFAIYLVEGITMREMWDRVGKDHIFLNIGCGIFIMICGLTVHYIWGLLNELWNNNKKAHEN